MANQPSKTRRKGNTVYHAPKGAVYHGDTAERPIGLTTEQAEDQRVGSKLDERQVRDAAQAKRATSGRARSDEITAARKTRTSS
jgi:hypothetical protein